MDHTANPRVVILGAGNVSSQLAKAFQDNGVPVIQIYARRLAQAQALAEQLQCEATDKLAALNREADIYILAVKDDAILQIVDELRLPGKIVAHTSGSVPMQALAPVTVHTGVFYPLQTFTAGRAVVWKEIPLCLEASDRATMDKLKALAVQLSDAVHKLDSEQRRWLHLSAVFVSNFNNYMLGLALEVLEGKELPLTLLEPLALETVRKAFAMGPDKAQTGPAIRGDVRTIMMHEEMLADKKDVLRMYRMLTESIRLTADKLNRKD